ncbi:hypothetical protein CY0110_19912 [Crocosphaera chwakensis CCY0110]|uniref:Uncharacterized protein n=1 Tax=Crocosphaera chwakensis CCY0110 TaxID=391612 RepID=A3IJW4_9CHRO|nr:hypothetical protein CY0110_19912 [Crocosphaera chwakensis CCY0110]
MAASSKSPSQTTISSKAVIASG